MCIEGQNINNNYRSQLLVTYGIVLTVTPTTYYSWKEKSNDFSNWPFSQPTTVTSVVLVKTQSLGGRNSSLLKRMNKILETPQKVWKSCFDFFGRTAFINFTSQTNSLKIQPGSESS